MKKVDVIFKLRGQARVGRRHKHNVPDEVAELLQKAMSVGYRPDRDIFIGYQDADGGVHYYAIDDIAELHITPDDPTAVDAKDL